MKKERFVYLTINKGNTQLNHKMHLTETCDIHLIIQKTIVILFKCKIIIRNTAAYYQEMIYTKIRIIHDRFFLTNSI
jgi:hypothetical protein